MIRRPRLEDAPPAGPTPDLAEILRTVRRIQILARRAVNDLLAGQYRSAFRGRGIEFDEVREYEPGDDVRDIDWNVTARSGGCYVKRYCEERELTVLLLVDVSASGAFGTVRRSKLELAAEAASLLMFSALKNNDKVGLILFADDVLEYLPPRKTKAHVLHAIRSLVSVRPAPRPTRLDRPLDFLNRVQKRRAVVFLVSDLLGPPAWRPLAIAARRHDLTVLHVSDPRETSLPNVGLLALRDPETGRRLVVDTTRRSVREAFAQAARRRFTELEQQVRRAGADLLTIRTDADYVAQLQKFFAARERRR